MFSGAGLGYIVIADAFSPESPNFHSCLLVWGLRSGFLSCTEVPVYVNMPLLIVQML
jgi:hypothetical protein